MKYRHEEEPGLYFAGDYNLRGRMPNADDSTSLEQLVKECRFDLASFPTTGRGPDFNLDASERASHDRAIRK